MRILCTLVLILLGQSFLFGQSPIINWQRSIGGSNDDDVHALVKTYDGNFVLAGFSKSNDGDISSNHNVGSSDFLILKIDDNGNIIWERNFGGTGVDEANSVIETTDKGFLVIGRTSSSDFDVYGFHSPADDVWIIKLDSAGNLQWQHCYGNYGSNGFQIGNDVAQTPDSGFVFVGYTTSSGIDVHGASHGGSDWWIVKINSQGSIQWDYCYGGSNTESALSVEVLGNGEILATGTVNSSDGNVTCATAGYQAWVVKLDPSGNEIWQRCYGGSNGTETGTDILANPDGSFYLLASTSSSNGDVSGFFGLNKIWLIKADSSGNILWNHCYGGQEYDRSEHIIRTLDNGLLICGFSDSPLPNYHWPGYDYIVVKLDSLGNLEWQGTYGGNGFEESFSCSQLNDSSYLIAGYAESNDGNVSFNHGGRDIWLIDLSASTMGVDDRPTELSSIQINISDDFIHIDNPVNAFKAELIVSDLLGRVLTRKVVVIYKGKNLFPLPNSLKGVLSIRLQSQDDQISIIINKM